LRKHKIHKRKHIDDKTAEAMSDLAWLIIVRKEHKEAEQQRKAKKRQNK